MKSLDLTQITMRSLQSPMIIAIVAGIVTGCLATCFSRHSVDRLSVGVRSLLGLILKAMGLIVHLVPLAVFASVAKVIGIYGLSFVGGLGAYLFFCLFGMVLHVVLVHQSWIVWVARMNLRRFWQEALEPVLYGFGVNGHLPPLPVTLRAVKRLGISIVPHGSQPVWGPTSTMTESCFTKLSLFYFWLRRIWTRLLHGNAGSYGVDLCIGRRWRKRHSRGGRHRASLALSAANLPIANIPLLLTVDWIIARSRSAVNVLADITVALSIDALTHRKTE